ncbi:hypothetical protein M431DRAFT_368317 [Trichoderma harzianum CBS 226.95]|uniref:Uncharacterized protein n=1 Tax=Trichoderma harzianum CBS 226.95 TaxID=983964 RepID=A0A2T3ZS94_TRIHA|nr:hypothetical protein M431DRAFT_368317 [Trichoderma harzianum CBS 226.95]PTB47680.1 hypothetical protein M431DRAFT_368317 [Trichoderma harzianum CBS 226.95]
MVLLSGSFMEEVSKVKLKLLVSVVSGPVAVSWCSSTNMVNSGCHGSSFHGLYFTSGANLRVNTQREISTIYCFSNPARFRKGERNG